MDKYIAVVRRKPGEDIEHWKYIKRTKVNGKWRYTYDKAQLKDDLDMGLEERKRLKEAEGNADFYKTIYEYTKERRDNPTAMDMKNFGGNAEKFKSEMDRQVVGTRVNAVKAEKYVQECLKKYGDTPLGKLENLIEDGKNTITYIIKTLPKKYKITKIGKGN